MLVMIMTIIMTIMVMYYPFKIKKENDNIRGVQYFFPRSTSNDTFLITI
jgi:hypothetical protein